MSWPKSVAWRMLCQKCRGSIYSLCERIKECRRDELLGDMQVQSHNPLVMKQAEGSFFHHLQLSRVVFTIYSSTFTIQIFRAKKVASDKHSLPVVRGTMTVTSQRGWPGWVLRCPVLHVMVDSVALVVGWKASFGSESLSGCLGESPSHPPALLSAICSCRVMDDFLFSCIWYKTCP